jgi:hypothetical protein
MRSGGISEHGLEGGAQGAFVRDVLMVEALQGLVIELDRLVRRLDQTGLGQLQEAPAGNKGCRYFNATYGRRKGKAWGNWLDRPSSHTRQTRCCPDWLAGLKMPPYPNATPCCTHGPEG